MTILSEDGLKRLIGARAKFFWGHRSDGGAFPGAMVGILQTVTDRDRAVIVGDNGHNVEIEADRFTYVQFPYVDPIEGE